MKEKSIISAVQFLSYAFILLITLITVFNIINTMTAQIAGRKKELAMLKSVGMTPKEFKKMLIFESMFYGLFGLLFGVPLSLVINRVVGYIISYSVFCQYLALSYCLRGSICYHRSYYDLFIKAY